MKKSVKIVGSLFVGLVGMFVTLSATGMIVGKDYKAGSSSPGTATASPATPQPPSAQEQVQALMGDEQKKFVSIVEAARQVYASAPNDMAKGAARPARAQAICSVLPSRTVEWVGRVAKLSATDEGKGVLQIEIGPKVSVKTWTNGMSDMGSNTLIEPSSGVFLTASRLRVGQPVRFVGALLQDNTDCVREASMSLADSIREPEFIMRFRSITPIR